MFGCKLSMQAASFSLVMVLGEDDIGDIRNFHSRCCERVGVTIVSDNAPII